LSGAAVVMLVELGYLFRDGGIGLGAWAVAGLFAGLGLGLGLALWIFGALAAPLRSAWARAFVCSLPALVVLVPVGRSLFEGARASTLPIAAFAPLWVPLAGLGFTAAAVRLGAALAERPFGRVGLSLMLPSAATAFEVANRRVLPSEYPDLHTALLVLTCLLSGMALRSWLGHIPSRFRGPTRRGPLVIAAAAVAGGALFAAALWGGLQDKASRRAVADHGMHGRHLVRVIHTLFDMDGDGYSALLGGGDDNDFDATIHPGARAIAAEALEEERRTGVLPASRGAESDGLREEQARLWRHDPEVQAFVRRASGMNVLLVVVDALRADALVPENRHRLPNFFRLLDESRWFTRALAPSAGTDLSMAGVLTGKVDPISGVEITLAEALSAAGYVSHAVVPREVLRAAPKTLLTRGLTSHEALVTDAVQRDVADRTSSDRVTERGLAFLDQWAKEPAQPFFLWLHYFDVHEHHQIPTRTEAIVAHNEGRVPTARDEKYRALVAVVDSALGQLRAGLAARKIAERTLVVLLSDHGESLREDPRLPDNHGRFLYNALVHVPLAVMIPGHAPAQIPQPVTLLDVTPTLLELVGARAARHGMQGESLLPLLLDGSTQLIDASRPLPLNETDQFGVVVWPYKLLVRPSGNLTELYDLSRDFHEKDDRADAEPALVDELLRTYHALPPVALDRTARGRARWEHNARASRPSVRAPGAAGSEH
jgi:arylsulfatase A-like enzyme